MAAMIMIAPSPNVQNASFENWRFTTTGLLS